MKNFDEFGMRKYLLQTVHNYAEFINPLFPNSCHDQENIVQNFIKFIRAEEQCFLRQTHPGHVTGSAFVVNPTFTKVLFTYHAKLKFWLQLGGHADGEAIVQTVALKEAQEESGMEHFKFFNVREGCFYSDTHRPTDILPFDLDIHVIPERPREPRHNHYDVRFILVAQQENFQISEESLDLKWIDIQDVEKYTQEASTLRQVYKLRQILKLG